MTTLLKGGRVIDPASGRDEVADVLLDGDTIRAVGPDLLGDNEIDVSGLIVGPGFIDLHSHAWTISGQRLAACDGVTTTLELEAGMYPVRASYERLAAEGRPLHYGFSASWGGARAAVLLGLPPYRDILEVLTMLGQPAWQQDSTPAQRDRWLGLLDDERTDGALGIGILQGYAPRTDPAEFLATAAVAARHGVPTYTHVRELVDADPTTPIDGSSEIVRAAGETGAAMHHCHVNSTSRRHIDRVLRTLADAQAEGSRVSVEAYPYGAGATAVGAAFLAPERLPIWDMTPSNLIIYATGERIADEAQLRELRAAAPGTEVITEYLDESDPADIAHLDASLVFPDSMVASDSGPVMYAGDGSHDTRAWPLPPGGRTHPRTAGSYGRSIRRMVRETGRWSWPEAFRRCSYLPAQTVPACASKGRIAPGADADVVVLDPQTYSDTATYSDPVSPTVGVRHLFVAGVPLIRGGELDAEAYPGRAVRG